MTNKCELTGKRPLKGHNVSHANNKTKRKWGLQSPLAKWMKNELQPFLRTTLVCGPQVALPSCHRRQDDTTSSTMLGVLESVIKSLVSGSDSNILAAGFRLRRAHDIGMCSLQMLESFFPNTLLNYLKSWEWDTLLTHVVRNITA